MPIEKEVTIKFIKQNGPLLLEVTSGFASLGSFVLSYAERDSYDYILFGPEPKRIDDNILDIYQIPVSLNNLEGSTVLINGKYAPGLGHSQVKVNYEFFQKGKKIGGDEILESPTDPSLRCSHTFYFEEDKGV